MQRTVYKSVRVERPKLASGQTLASSCTFTALSKAFNCSVDELMQGDIGRGYTVRNGVYGHVIMAELRHRGWEMAYGKSWGRGDKQLRFKPSSLPRGRCVVFIRDHVVYVNDGIVHDTYNSMGRGLKHIEYIYVPTLEAATLWRAGIRAKGSVVEQPLRRVATTAQAPTSRAGRITAIEAAEQLGVKPMRMRQLCRQGRIAGAVQEANGRWLIPTPVRQVDALERALRSGNSSMVPMTRNTDMDCDRCSERKAAYNVQYTCNGERATLQYVRTPASAKPGAFERDAVYCRDCAEHIAKKLA